MLTYAWSRLDVDEGLGLVRLDTRDPVRVEGHEVVVDGGEAWAVTFRVELDREWRTRVTQIAVIDEASERKLLLEADGEGNWLRDGAPSPELQGCLDVDIAATPFTNTFVIRRLGLAVAETAEIRAAWIGVPHLEVEALEQTYVRLQPRGGLDRYEYRAGAGPPRVGSSKSTKMGWSWTTKGSLAGFTHSTGFGQTTPVPKGATRYIPLSVLLATCPDFW